MAEGTPRLHAVLTAEPEGRAALALAAELTAAGILAADEAKAVLRFSVKNQRGRRAPGHAFALAAIRVAARLAPQFPTREEGDWAPLFCTAMHAASLGHHGPMDTDEALDSMTAVAAFMLHLGEDMDGPLLDIHKGDFGFAMRIGNTDLDAHLRERPQDLGRIIKYFEARGTDRSGHVDMPVLREYLGAEASAVADGWL